MAPNRLEELNRLREEKSMELHDPKGNDGEIEIRIGMGSSGIASGARDILRVLNDTLKDRGITKALIRQTGSLGLDYAEPTVEVRMHGMPDTIYGRVTPEVAQQIVDRHILGRELVCGHVFDRPAPDMVKEPNHAR